MTKWLINWGKELRRYKWEVTCSRHCHHQVGIGFLNTNASSLLGLYLKNVSARGNAVHQSLVGWVRKAHMQWLISAKACVPMHHCLILSGCVTGNPAFTVPWFSEISFVHEESSALAHINLVKFVISSMP